MLREALETQIGRLRDNEVPSKNLIASKMEDIETNMPRHEDLCDVASIEDGEADLLQGNLDPSSGTFKLKAARNTVSMPKTAEELRLRHRRLGVAWEMARTRHLTVSGYRGPSSRPFVNFQTTSLVSMWQGSHCRTNRSQSGRLS